MKANKEKFARVQIFLGGFLFLINGNLLLEKFPEMSIVLFILGGILLLYVAALVLNFPLDPVLRLLMTLIEGIGFLGTAYLFFHTGKVYLPYCYLLGALLCFLGVYMKYRKNYRVNR